MADVGMAAGSCHAAGAARRPADTATSRIQDRASIPPAAPVRRLTAIPDSESDNPSGPIVGPDARAFTGVFARVQPTVQFGAGTTHGRCAALSRGDRVND